MGCMRFSVVLLVVLISGFLVEAAADMQFPNMYQQSSHHQHQSPSNFNNQAPSNNMFDYFFRTSLRRPSRDQENATINPTTEKPSTSTQRLFTGIAFPPQVFEILTGSEPSTQNLGGRKNATQNSTHLPGTPNKSSTSTTNKFPEFVTSSMRPPSTRFPPNNKPPYMRPTQRPSASHGSSSNSRPPQAGSIAAAHKPSTEAPDHRVGNPGRLTTSTREPLSSAWPWPPNPTTPAAPTHTQYRPQLPNQCDIQEAKRSISSIHQYLQMVLTSGTGGSGASWDSRRGNFLVSPLSVGLTMSQMLMAGGPKAKSHIRDALRLYTKSDPHEEVRHELNYHKQLGSLVLSMQRHDNLSSLKVRTRREPADPYVLETSTAIFVQTGLMVRPTFIHGLENLYHGQLNLVNFRGDPFGTLASINQWSDDATRGKIKQFLPGPPSRNTAALFASSLYFKAPWRKSFDTELTTPGRFHVSRTETISVPFMRGVIEEGCKHIDSDKFGVRALSLSYNDTEDIAIYIFLPKSENTSIEELAKKLLIPYSNNNGNVFNNQRMDSSNLTPIKSFQDPLPASWEAHKQVTAVVPPPFNIRTHLPEEDNDKWVLDEIISGMKPREILVVMPKFTLRGSIRLSPPHNGSGNDQLAGLLEDPDQALGATFSETIIHETILEVTEAGTEAAAVSGDAVNLMLSLTFKIDRPFLVLLRHEPSGLPLFWGAVVRPETSTARHRQG